MKKLSLKSKILLGAFLVSGLAAGAQEVAFQIANANQQQYQWNGSGPNHTGSFSGTKDAALTRYGCLEEAPTVCATGTAPGMPDETIYRP